ncbi:hypothetical protein EYF80_058604 [Liparis tanakae]|uniref:Uncharacterized protein n=1 Tax=Liparis tanakae TaxID=230148 RepID=A0A4Z2ESA6_9TELE|nr:hypothetical protein EYF80_058604 [Liparis tanakae]
MPPPSAERVHVPVLVSGSPRAPSPQQLLLRHLRSQDEAPHLEACGHLGLYLASNIHGCCCPTQDLALNISFRMYFITSACARSSPSSLPGLRHE